MQDFLDLFSNVTNFTWQAGLMIAIGCTGGRHRSVALCQALACTEEELMAAIHA